MSTGRWFRFYDDTINDPKTLKLSDKTYRIWVGLLCAASKNDGVLPPFEDLAILLRIKSDKLQPELEKLIEAKLLDHTDVGISPHNWNKRQYISDSSVERVKRHRAKRAANGLQSQWTVPKALRKKIYERDKFECVYCGSEDDLSIDHKTPELRGGTHDPENLQTACRACNGAKRDMTHDEYVSRNGGVTLLKRPQSTEAENRADSEKKDSRAVAKATRPKTSETFEEFWRTYPRRLGANPKKPAFAVYEAAIKQGAEPSAIIEGARRCAADDHDKIGTPYIPQAVKWLRDRRWEDYAAGPPTSSMSDVERTKLFEKLRGTNGKSEREGTDLRGAGAGSREVEGAGRKEPTAIANHQARNAGMASVDAIFREPPGLRAGGDEARSDGFIPRIYSAG